MANLGCYCGTTLYDTGTPSQNRIHIYTESEIQASLKLVPKLKFWDFTYDSEKFPVKNENQIEYWYCTDCGRVYVVPHKPNALTLWVYEKLPGNIPDGVRVDKSWERLHIFTDTEGYDAAEANNCAGYDTVMLEDFIYRRPRKFVYFISPDEKYVVAQNAADKTFAFAYERKPITRKQK